MILLVSLSFGIVIGYLLRRHTSVLALSRSLSGVAIYLLLLLLGFSVGSDRTLTTNFSALGIQALLLSAGAIVGSLLLSTLLYRSRLFHEE